MSLLRPSPALENGQRRTAVLALLLLLASALSAAATGTGATDATAPTSAGLKVQRAEIEQAAGLNEEQRKQALTRIDEAVALLEQAEQIERQAAELQARIRLGPDQLARATSGASDGLGLNLTEIEPWTNHQLEVVLNERQRKLEEMRQTLDDKDRQLNDYLAKTRTGGAELADLKKVLAELQDASAATGAAPAADAMTASEQSWRAARARMLRAREQLLGLQQGNLNLLIELARLDRDAAAAQVKAFEQHVSAFRAYLQRRRQSEAEAVKQEATENLNDAPAAIRSLQREITELAAEHARLVAEEARFERHDERITRQIDQVKKDRERIQQMVELGGSTAHVSALLQKRRALAPAPKTLNQQLVKYQQMLSDAGLRQLELDEQLRSSVDAEARIEALLGTSAKAADGAERERLRTSAREAWSRYRDTALDLWKSYTRYLGKLSKLEGDTRTLVQEARAYRTFIDDRLLWLPSTELAPLGQPGLVVAGLSWLVSPAHLEGLLRDGLLVLTQRGAATAFWLAGLLLLFGLRLRARRGLARAAEVTHKVRTDSFMATLEAVGHTLVLVLALPWLLVGAGLLLGGLAAAEAHTLVIAAGLQGAGHALLFLNTLRQFCRPNGLASCHLNWNPALCEQLGRQAAWLRPLAVPLSFLTAAGAVGVPSEFVKLASVVQNSEPGLLSLGRVALIAQLILLGIAVHRVWRKEGRVMQAFAETPERTSWPSYHLIWFGPALLIPTALALAAASGFFYTAVFLTAKAGETLWFLLMLILLKDLLLRGLYVAQRRLRFEEALRHREEALHSGGEAATATDVDNLPLDEEKVNYNQLGEQVRQLVRMGYTISLLVGLWWIWADVVPAFGFLNQVELPITTSKLVEGVSQSVPLTLGDMVAGLLLGGLALFAARNIPALLELTVLQRLPMSRASRYAFTTLTQYLVATLGLVISFKALGLQWSSIQWLVAALSVGLGFGLQEIVANFISGIILLFEQPIRVGDVVTVDGTTGTVSRIRIRATTIVNWERQELVIPNKSFITGRLINWTLSDTVNRVFISVGVSYQTDTRQAMQLMTEAAAEHPKVLTDPPPRISFEGFGDNALTLNMRAFLSEVDARLQTITELHQSVLDRFRDAGIEIAYPQRDVHVEAKQPFELLLRRAGPSGASPSPDTPR